MALSRFPVEVHGQVLVTPHGVLGPVQDRHHVLPPPGSSDHVHRTHPKRAPGRYEVATLTVGSLPSSGHPRKLETRTERAEGGHTGGEHGGACTRGAGVAFGRPSGELARGTRGP